MLISSAVFATIMLLLPSQSPRAASRVCTPAQARKAEDVAGKASSWTGLHDAFKKFGHCDDGAIAEGFSDSTVSILAGQWNTLPQLLTLIRKDPLFGQFVLRHVDATADANQLMEITIQAKQNCPTGGLNLCSDLHDAAWRAIKAIEETTTRP